MKSYLLITHKRDYDGMFCEQLLRLAVGEQESIVCMPSEVDVLEAHLDEAWEQRKRYKQVFITDIPILTEVICKKIENIGQAIPLEVIDHHIGTLKRLPQTPYREFKLGQDRVSASFLFYKYLKDHHYAFEGINHKRLLEVVKCISDWDTWLWKDEKNKVAKKISLFYSEEPQACNKRLIEYAKVQKEFEREESLEEFLGNIPNKHYQEAMTEYRSKINSGKKCYFKGHKVAVMEMPENIPEAFKSICIDEILEGDLDICILRDSTTVRFYSIRYDVRELVTALGLDSQYGKPTYQAKHIKTVMSRFEIEDPTQLNEEIYRAICNLN